METKRIRRFFFILAAIGCCFTIMYLILTGNANQVYTDIVNEHTAQDASNKSAERNLFYILTLAGGLFYTLYFFWCQRKAGLEERESMVSNRTSYLVVMVLALTAAYYLVWQETSPLLLLAMLYLLLLLLRQREWIAAGLTCFFLNAYAIMGLYRLYLGMGGEKELNGVVIAVLALLVSLVPLAFREKKTAFLRSMLISQIAIPFVLLLYTNANYLYEGEKVTVAPPLKIRVLIYGLIAAFIVEGAWKLKKYWKNQGQKELVVTYGVCVAIMACNRFSGNGAIISTDLHHPMEDIIGYSQVFELGQQLFSEYIPVSGMYSLVHGFLFEFLGHGQLANYAVVQNVLYLLVIMAVVLLLKVQLRDEVLLLISLVLLVPDYNRIIFIIPVMLLLSWQKLIARKNLWLKAWFLTSLVQGLYYPVFGAAVCIGFLPLAIRQMIALVRTGELKELVRKPAFWIWWAVCILPAVISIPWLIGTLKHTLAMSGQTVYADGLTRFGQGVPGSLLPYIQSMSLRLVLYNILSFMVIPVIFWLSIALTLKLGKIRIEKKKLVIGNGIQAGIAFSFGIVLLISLSYTVIRLDSGSIYARSVGVIYAVFVMLMLLVTCYLQTDSSRYWVLGFAAFLLVLAGKDGVGILNEDGQLQSRYVVPDGYTYVTDSEIKHLGTGFIENGMYESVQDNYKLAQSLNRDNSYIGIYSLFGYYYLGEVKADSVVEINTVRGYEAARESIDVFRKNHTIIGGKLEPFDNYYYYYWLITSGEYVYDADTGYMVPNVADFPAETVRSLNKNLEKGWNGYSLGRSASSMGLSMDSLSEIFTEVDANYQGTIQGNVYRVDFDAPVDGNQADFVYVEFKNMDENFQYIFHDADTVYEGTGFQRLLMKKDYNPGMYVETLWADDKGETHYMDCDMGQGKLLIPLGAGRQWLLNEHSYLNIYACSGDDIIDLPEVAEVKFLKLREAD